MNATVARDESRAVDGSFLLLLALLSAAIGYRFGMGNQEEQIPIILRQLDPAYLANDFFVSSSTEFGPRLYYAKAVAWLAGLTSLPFAYALLRTLSDLALAAVTWWGAVRLVGADRLGAMIAAVLALTVPAFHLGDATELRYVMFQPATAAIPGMLLAIGLGVLGRPLPAAIAASAASLVHPLYGVYGGVLGLSTAFVARLPGWPERAHRRRAIVESLLAGLVFAGGLLAFWWWPSTTLEGALTTEELFAILGRFRSPHHYFPSEFRLADYAATALFACAGGLAFERWARGTARHRATVILVPLAGVLAGCLAGTVFTEVWPVGAILTLQPFRLLAVLKWIGFLLIGWRLAVCWRQPALAVARPLVIVCLLSPGGLFPFVATAVLAALRFRPWFLDRLNPILLTGGLAALVAALWLRAGSADEQVRLLAALGLTAAFAQPRRPVRLAGAALAALLVAAIVSNRPTDAAYEPSPVRPIVTMDDLRGPAAAAARAASETTPPGATFVAPPTFGILRFVGSRALVVDFEAIPFQPAHMREWRERIRRVYGDVEGTGHAARAALDASYRRVTDAHLGTLAREYGATHAVLYRETATALPSVYENERYRIVRLSDRPARASSAPTRAPGAAPRP